MFSQVSKQSVRGIVKDRWTGKELADAGFILNDGQRAERSDSSGRFRLEQLESGRYRLSCFVPGYVTWVIPDLWISSGKETVLEIFLEELHTDLPEITLQANAPPRQGGGQVELLSQEMTLRFPATFYDPARLASTLAGVATDNDQANGLVIHNYSPNGVNWRLWGAEIINPNHTANAGTFSDRVTGNAGGVNMISMQLLDNTAFYTGTPPVSYGNTASGTLDMSLRPGNSERREFTLQAGLIGLDVAAEGPMNRSSRLTPGASYVVNYRYSTIGMLQGLGLDLGDEAIAFQDFSAHINLPTKQGSWHLFGILGKSSNRFTGSADSTAWKEDKDPYTIDFKSGSRILGARYTRGIFSSTWVYSSGKFSREAQPLFIHPNRFPASLDTWEPQKVSNDTRITATLGKDLHLLTGLNLTHNRQERTLADADLSINGQLAGWQISPYAGLLYQRGRWQAELGFHSLWFTWNGSYSLEPRIGLVRRLNAQSTLSIHAGKSSQLQPVQVYLGSGYPENSRLDLTHIWQGSLTLERVGKAGVWTGQVYKGYFDRIPIAADQSNSFSTINVLEEIVRIPLVSKGLAQQWGAFAQHRIYWKNGFYSLVNLHGGKLQYQGSDGIWREGRFSHRYLLNVTLGKEWRGREKRGKIREFGWNGRLIARAGFREMPVDLVNSRLQQTTVYDFGRGFANPLANYFRIDLRLYAKWNARTRTHMLSLDIQNASGEKQVVYHYYDRVKQALMDKRQLGLIPILTYRVNLAADTGKVRNFNP